MPRTKQLQDPNKVSTKTLIAEQTRFSGLLLRQRLAQSYAETAQLETGLALAAIKDAATREAQALKFSVELDWEQLSAFLQTDRIVCPGRTIRMPDQGKKRLLSASVFKDINKPRGKVLLELVPEAAFEFGVFGSPAFVHSLGHLGLTGLEGAGAIALAQRFKFADVPGQLPSLWLCPTLSEVSGRPLVAKVVLDAEDAATPFYERLCAREGLTVEVA